MNLGRTIAIFGSLSTAWQCTRLVLHHPTGYHAAAFDPRWAVPMQVLGIGIYVGAGLAAARCRAYVGVPVGAAVAGAGFVLGSALSYVVVPGSLGLMMDAMFWRERLRREGVPMVALGVVGGAIGAALSLAPTLRTIAGTTR